MQLAARITVRFATFLALAGGLLVACGPTDPVSIAKPPDDPVENAPNTPDTPDTPKSRTSRTS
jgi:hypothetical protein